MLEAIAAADVVKISDEELLFLTGSTDPSAARSELWQAHHRLMVVTLGPSGCVFITDGATGMVGGFSVASVDATGAGDAFVAGLLDGLLAHPGAPGDPDRLPAICRFACAVGALTTTGRGAIPALPTRAAVERFLNP
jgi:fructokinase